RLQDQYLECQELLALYQQYLSEQQEKLTRSISQLNHTHTTQEQQSCGKRSPAPLPQAAVDGSYLGLPSPRRGSGGLNFRMPSSHRDKNRVALGRQAHSPLQQGTPSVSGSEDGSPEYWGLPLRPQLGGSEPRPGRPDQLRETQLMNGELRRAGMTEPRVGRHSHHREAQGSGRQVPEVSLTGPELPPLADMSEPQGSRGLSDERRHRLMLQKLEVEVERERLQALLAQQEEKLLRQQRQLSQSRLDYSSLFPAQPESRLSAAPVQEKSRAPPVQEDWEEEPRSVIVVRVQSNANTVVPHYTATLAYRQLLSLNKCHQYKNSAIFTRYIATPLSAIRQLPKPSKRKYKNIRRFTNERKPFSPSCSFGC
ncbi:UNVERIFIED_CONTAM: hypothetical protein FKN15_002427, partial [Acipenser sinensis]